MPSFAALSLLVTATLGAVSSALPFGSAGSSVVARGYPAPAVAAVDASHNNVNAVTANHDKRCGCDSLPVIFADAHVALGVSLDKFRYVTAGNSTSEFISPVVDEIKVTLNGVLVKVQALVGVSINDILLGTDGVTVVAAADILAIVSGCFGGIFVAIAALLKVCVDVTVVLPLLCAIGEILGAIVVAVVAVVVDLTVLDFCAPFAAFQALIVQLNINAFIGVFGW